MVNPDQDKPSYEELLQQNQVLLQELSNLRAEKRALWVMLAGTNRRLQMSSAAIKAAVSSLLNYDIFWDGANQHEFLETINTSVDQAGRLVKLMTLAFRLESGTLSLKREPEVLQEIVSAVQDHIGQRFPHLTLGVTLPEAGGPALVDYEFLMMALEFLVEVIEYMGIRRMGIQAVEEADRWILKFEGLDDRAVQAFRCAYENCLGQSSTSNLLVPEHRLRLYIINQILVLQGIRVEITGSSDQVQRLRLLIPTM